VTLFGDDAGVADLLVLNLQQADHHPVMTELLQSIIAIVAIACVPTLSFLVAHIEADTSCDINIQDIQLARVALDLDEEMTPTIGVFCTDNKQGLQDHVFPVSSWSHEQEHKDLSWFRPLL
jgi:hypothetical protein